MRVQSAHKTGILTPAAFPGRKFRNPIQIRQIVSAFRDLLQDSATLL
jgi:hypothetical protein